MQSSDAGGEDSTAPAASDGGAGAGPDATVPAEEASGSPAPTVEAQAPGSALVVTGVEIAPPEGWQVTGVSADDTSEVVSATSEDGQLLSVRSVRSEITAEEHLAELRAADSDQAADAPELVADGETLQGVETRLATSGGEIVQLQYVTRRGDSLITIDLVTTAEGRDALLDQVASGTTWT
ncbi:hypothetical protein [Brachybacterium sp. J153]|uniref:hypothetical protein n=1 Tax=Brachybacterium sp. J153 TaxID=3116488 RepID=UPI002E75C9A4|nr:hypothetical protein [Brachybacterium sp. J153]MEE1617848.1 hypothetical protein [Brachybacterium sp. J153]